MKEYEYSFKVKDLEPYIDYCENSDYELIFNNSEIRDLYTSNNNVLARLTTNEDKIIIDFKDKNEGKEVLKVRKESLPLEINKDDIVKIQSILDILEYKLFKRLIRKRLVYQKGNVKFELDEYKSPEAMCVVAIEGNKEEVDEVYNYIVKNINIIY